MNRSARRGQICVIAVMAIVLIKALQAPFVIAAIVWVATLNRTSLRDLGFTLTLLGLQSMLPIGAAILCYFLYQGRSWARWSLLAILLGLLVLALVPSLLLLATVFSMSLFFGAFANGQAGIAAVFNQWLAMTQENGSTTQLVLQLLAYLGGLALLLSPDVTAFLSFRRDRSR